LPSPNQPLHRPPPYWSPRCANDDGSTPRYGTQITHQKRSRPKADKNRASRRSDGAGAGAGGFLRGWGSGGKAVLGLGRQPRGGARGKAPPGLRKKPEAQPRPTDHSRTCAEPLHPAKNSYFTELPHGKVHLLPGQWKLREQTRYFPHAASQLGNFPHESDKHRHLLNPPTRRRLGQPQRHRCHGPLRKNSAGR